MLVQAHGSNVKIEAVETAQDRNPKQPRTAKASPSPLQGHRTPLPGMPAHVEAAQSVTESLTSGAWDAPQAHQLHNPGPEASAYRVSQLHSAAHGSAGGASQRQVPLQQEPEERESGLPKSACKAGEQRGCGTSSELGSLPIIADLPRISSQYPELQDPVQRQDTPEVVSPELSHAPPSLAPTWSGPPHMHPPSRSGQSCC
ncbi:g4827 [Coccomyxa viridis]|uniref:G4827 protein n=1 Tax=Coccomyxa viridis TaxID=1274662 RepID=A0ABP1FR85_9CHLO